MTRNREGGALEAPLTKEVLKPIPVNESCSLLFADL